jgi:hypothetical protein
MNKDTVWAGFFGLVYCKFFWDFVNGTLRNPGGIQCVLQTSLSYAVPESPFILIRVPRLAKQDAFFIDIIVKAPVIPIISMILGFVIVALKYPAPFMKGLVLRHARVGANGPDQRSASWTSEIVRTGDRSSPAGSSYAKYCCTPRLNMIMDNVATTPLQYDIILIYYSYRAYCAVSAAQRLQLYK